MTLSQSEHSNSVLQQLQKSFSEALQALDIDVSPEDVDITPSTRVGFGQYQCNSALQLAKKMQKNPRELANDWVTELEKDKSIITSLEVAGPGFINITLAEKFLENECSLIAQDPYLGARRGVVPQRIAVDFSSPNIAKNMHVGHLRSTIIGASLANALSFMGHDVLRLNHFGDWGTQFGMLIAYIKKYKPDVLTKKDLHVDELMVLYQKSKKEFDAVPEFKDQSRKEVTYLHDGNKESLAIWEAICQASRESFDKVYEILDIKITERGESYYHDLLAGVIEDFEKKGLVTVSGGAKCVFLPGFKNKEGDPLPLIIQKADGAYNYATTDLATFKQRVETERVQRIVMVNDAGQKLHFRMVTAAAKAVGYYDESKVRFDHVTFGVVLDPQGKKYKTRDGDTEPLIGLLHEAEDKAKKVLQERNTETDNIDRDATILGVGAVKYADLSGNRHKDYIFSYDRMLRFEGNTVPFILYAYVRIQSIQRRLGVTEQEVLKDVQFKLEHPSEISLALWLTRFGQVMDLMTDELMPNRLTDYLHTVAEEFHAFFRDCRVDGTDQQKERLCLCALTAVIIRKGLGILGIGTLEHM